MSRIIFLDLGENSQEKNISEFKNQLELLADLEGLHLKTKLATNRFYLGSLSLMERDFTSETYGESVHILIDGNLHYLEEISKKLNIHYLNDEDFIRKLFLKYPNDWQSYLVGTYSVIVFDEKNEKIYAARDHFGTKPLFYIQQNNYFCLGSEIKIIKAFPKFTLSFNKKKIIQYLSLFKENNVDTFFNEIKSLEPANILQCTNGNFISKKYSYKLLNKYEFKSEDNAKQTLLTLLKNATKERINSAYTPGCLVSGGLDSACIYALLCDELNTNRIDTFSMNFINVRGEDLACDETHFQELLVNKDTHHRVKFDGISPYSRIDTWLERFDQPFNLANAYLWEETFNKAAKTSNQIFDGLDGDTVISHGWERLKELFDIKTIWIFFKELYLYSKKHSYLEYTNRSLFMKFLMPLIKNNYLFFWLRGIKINLFPKKNNLRRIIKKPLLNQINFRDNYGPMNIFRNHKEKIKNTTIDTAFTNLNILFYKKGVSQESPFFDINVVDFCINLPSDMKLKNGSSRYILREAFKDKVPKEIIERYSKANLTINFLNNINESDIEHIQREINSPHPFLNELVDFAVLNEYFDKVKNKTMNEIASMSIWTYYLTNKWLKKMHK